MSDSKGKGKTTAEPSKDNDASSSSSNPINSLLSNVASSATGLARSAFAAPSSDELNNASSSGLLGNGKGQSSSSLAAGSSAYAGSSRLANQASSSAGQAQAWGAQPQGFRTAQEHAQASEAEFSSFLDGIPSMEADMSALNLSGSTAFPAETALPTTYQPQPSHLADDHPHPASRHMKSFSNEEFIRYSAHQPSHSLQPSLSQPGSYSRTYSTVQDAQAHDGADVLAILDTFTPQTLDYFEPQTIEQEVENWHLTREQYDLAKKLANELHITPAVANQAQMVPRTFQDEEKAEYLPEEYAQDSFGQFGKVLPAAEAREKWVEQWESVLNRYQDEVWGGMAALVKEANEEVKEIVEGSGGEQSKALARLGLVLGHISGVQQQVGTENGKDREQERQTENELMEAGEREAHNVPVNYRTLDQSCIHAGRMEEMASNGSNPYPSGPPTGEAMEDAWTRSNYGPQIYMQPAEAAQAREYKAWFKKGVTSNKRWRTGGQDSNSSQAALAAYKSQLNELERQNKARLMRQRQEREAATQPGPFYRQWREENQ